MFAIHFLSSLKKKIFISPELAPISRRSSEDHQGTELTVHRNSLGRNCLFDTPEVCSPDQEFLAGLCGLVLHRDSVRGELTIAGIASCGPASKCKLIDVGDVLRKIEPVVADQALERESAQTCVTSLSMQITPQKPPFGLVLIQTVPHIILDVVPGEPAAENGVIEPGVSCPCLPACTAVCTISRVCHKEMHAPVDFLFRHFSSACWRCCTNDCCDASIAPIYTQAHPEVLACSDLSLFLV
jgi:hypothetical protein